jgi:DNA invertase Pin-like site-specific DNA recombinase
LFAVSIGNHRESDEMSGGSPIRRDQTYAAIYARVSTEDQGKGFSIPTQSEAWQKLGECEGYTVPQAHDFIDQGVSVTTMDRPGLRRLRKLVQIQAMSAALVIDPDRLSRSLGHQFWLAEEMLSARDISRLSPGRVRHRVPVDRAA